MYIHGINEKHHNQYRGKTVVSDRISVRYRTWTITEEISVGILAGAGGNHVMFRERRLWQPIRFEIIGKSLRQIEIEEDGLLGVDVL